ncbi:MAG TPA: SDR family oxidoreductase, partial [Acidimicrobiia bacterium]|nr:SDR family oxidoreductase [Acidimicrobiia bacterium]
MGALDGKVAMVTGGGSGIGRAAATRFRAEGAAVCIVDFSEAAKAVADELDGVFVQGDVGDPSVNAVAVETCEQELGGLDVAYLNAGVITPEADITKVTDEQYARIMNVNVNGVVFGTRSVVPAMERRGGGSIVVTASLAGLIAYPVDPIYALTKHAVVGFVRGQGPLLAERGIRINAVNPGIVATALVPEDAQAALTDAGFPLLAASDVADAVMRILASDGAGECWPVQPGRDPEPYRFRQVPGPRAAGSEGMRPPLLSG